MTVRAWRPGIPAAIVLALALACSLLPLARAERRDQQGSTSTSNEIFDRIWRGAEQAEKKHQNGCGTLTETRTSPLLARPLVMRGTFCANSNARFRLDYVTPSPIRIIYNEGVVNVSTDAGRNVEAFDIGSAVGRVREYFGGANARRNVERDFRIDAQETSDRYTLRLTPVSGRISRSVTRVEVDFGRTDFMPLRLEIRGKSGVTSVFDIRIDTLDGALSPTFFDVFRVKPKAPREGRQDRHPAVAAR
jgi:outer membrane lipoprotein-sorting protein